MQVVPLEVLRLWLEEVEGFGLTVRADHDCCTLWSGDKFVIYITSFYSISVAVYFRRFEPLERVEIDPAAPDFFELLELVVRRQIAMGEFALRTSHD